MPIMQRTAPSGNQATICAMLDRHGMQYHCTTDRRTGLERIHVRDTFVCNGRSNFILKDVTNWSLHKLGCWLGY